MVIKEVQKLMTKPERKMRSKSEIMKEKKKYEVAENDCIFFFI